MSEWISRYCPEYEWTSVCYGNGIFVAVEKRGQVMTSLNGINNWTLRTTPSGASGYLASVCYGNGTFVGVYSADYSYAGETVNVITSSDGITWNPRTAPVSHWISICYGNGMFVAISDNNPINSPTPVTIKLFMTSSNAVDWTALSLSIVADNSWRSICYGNDKFVAVGFYNDYFVYATSSNGTVWAVVRTTKFLYQSIYSICYGNGVFVVLSYNSSSILYSTDGINWKSVTLLLSKKTVSRVSFGDGIFVAIAVLNSVNYTITSVDGIIWKEQILPITIDSNNPIINICYGGYVFIAVMSSGTGNRLITSESPSLTCYLIGTRILCLVDNIETYVPIQDIRKGTLVKTYNHGYIPVKLIGKRNCMNNMTIAQNCLYKMKETGLSITGAHSILVDKLPTKLIEKYEFYTKNHKIEDKYILLACDSDLFEPFADCNEYTLYHLCLESESPNDHFGIWAEGVLSESTSENDYNDGFFVNTG